MKLYIDDLERVVSLTKLHENMNRRFGSNPLCTINAIDANGNILGVVSRDSMGKTCFEINKIGSLK